MTPKWLNFSDADRIVQTRWQCYGDSGKDITKFKEILLGDRRVADGDFLIIEENGRDIGTATSISMKMWVRGAPVSCQGVAWVGAIKTARRRGAARMAMAETLKTGRERGHVVSALMPFRASFYEHFGYGIVERRADWTIPLPILHSGDAGSWHPVASSDYPAMAALRQRVASAGQCDIERSQAGWEDMRLSCDKDLNFCSTTGSWVTFYNKQAGGKDLLKVSDWGAADFADVSNMLKFLGTLRDQYASVTITVPADWQLHLLLRETQIPHRPVNHLTADTRVMTRMQMRILDHAKFLSALRVPGSARGKATIEVRECEGNSSAFTMDCNAGRIEAKPATGSADFQCLDRHWAAIATGELPATLAVKMGLVTENKSGTATILEAAFSGPAPFCGEYF